MNSIGAKPAPYKMTDRDVMPEAREFYEYDSSKRKISEQYERIKLILGTFSGTVVPVLFSLLLLFSGESLIIERSIAVVTQSYWIQVGVFVLIFIFSLQIIEAPFAFYSSYVVDHRFGLSTQDFRGWIADQLKEIGIGTAFGVLLGLMLYYLISEIDYWWLAAAALLALLEVVLSMILPYVLMPIFYKMTPLADEQLRRELLEMSSRMGAKNIAHVLVADESRKSVRANAMFSGIGSTRAIVLFDTLLNGFTRREIVTVVAHELGHYVNKDIWKSAITSALLILPPFIIADFVLRNNAASLGITSIKDPAGFPLIFAILVGVSFIIEPISNGFSRLLEGRADQFALVVANDPDAQASSERRLADLSLSVDKPRRLVELFFYTHPSPSNRVRRAEDWKNTHGQRTNFSAERAGE